MAKPLTNVQKKKIIASYLVTNCYSDTAREFGVSVNTVRSLVLKAEKQDPKFAKDIKQKAEKENQSVIQYLESLADLKKKALHNLLSGIVKMSETPGMFDNPKDYATAYGILCDKELKIIELQIANAGNARTEETEGLSKALEEMAISLDNNRIKEFEE